MNFSCRTLKLGCVSRQRRTFSVHRVFPRVGPFRFSFRTSFGERRALQPPLRLVFGVLRSVSFLADPSAKWWETIVHSLRVVYPPLATRGPSRIYFERGRSHRRNSEKNASYSAERRFFVRRERRKSSASGKRRDESRRGGISMVGLMLFDWRRLLVFSSFLFATDFQFWVVLLFLCAIR